VEEREGGRKRERFPRERDVCIHRQEREKERKRERSEGEYEIKRAGGKVSVERARRMEERGRKR
jgi:hypothetical protein